MQSALRPDDLVAPHEPERIAPWWSWPLIAIAIAAASYLSVYLTAPSSSIAMWWPAAGIGACLVLRAGRERRLAALATVAVSTLAGNLVGGREPILAVPFSILNAVEIAVVVLILARGTTRFRLRAARDAFRLLLAAAAGAAATGVLTGITVAALQRGDVGEVMLHTAASHAAALLLIIPFASLPARSPQRVSPAEAVTQSLLLTASVVVVFAPWSVLPLSFVPFAFLVWSASRLPALLAFTQALLVAVAGLVLTILGGGPFYASSLSTNQLALVVEVYMVIVAAFTIMLVTARYETRAAMQAATSASQLITGGLVDSQVGLVIAEERAGVIRLVWANRAAFRVLEDELGEHGTWEGPLARNARVSMAERVQTVHERPAGGGVISLLANPIPEQNGRFSAQLVDVSASVRMTRAREAAERDRAAARTTLVDLERQREDLVAATSHELRTPITSIAGYTELLQESPELPERERSWVAVIARNTERLSELVEDLLTLGGSRSDASPRRIRPLALAELAAGATDPHRALARAKRLSLVVEVDPGLVVHGSTDDLTRAIANLVANAVKFTPDGGVVRIWSDAEAGRIALRITDTGPGMSPDTLAQAFDRFYRGAAAENANAPGTGLGITIAEQLMARHGGRVVLDSRPGEGLTASAVFREAMPQD